MTARRRVAFASCIVLIMPSVAPFTVGIPSALNTQTASEAMVADCRHRQSSRNFCPLYLSTWNEGEEPDSISSQRKKRQHPSRRKRSQQRQQAAQQRKLGTRAPPIEEDVSFADASPPEDALEDAIDSFLRGEYDRPFAEDAPAPHPGLGPSETVDAALRSLRDLNVPEPSHGAAVFLRFCAPLSRGDRWGGGPAPDQWKELLRGAITPTMLARRIRASPFSGLLDWERLDVTEGLFIPSTRQELGVGTTIAFVSAAMFFGDGVEPSILQFTLRKIGGVWLIDTAVISKKEWFVGDKAS